MEAMPVTPVSGRHTPRPGAALPALPRLGRWESSASLLLVALLLSAACTRVKPLVILPNEIPTVAITSAPSPGTVLGNYSYDIRWAGRDADGRIDHFLYAVDPPSRAGSDTAWTATQLNRRVFVFPADSLPSDNGLVARRFHTVVVWACPGSTRNSWVMFC